MTMGCVRVYVLEGASIGRGGGLFAVFGVQTRCNRGENSEFEKLSSRENLTKGFAMARKENGNRGPFIFMISHPSPVIADSIFLYL